jgi:lipopolysaccharide export system protein LptC
MRIRFATAAIFAWTLSAAGCRPGRPVERRDLVPELIMEGVRFRVDRQGESRATGEANRVTYRRDTTAVTASGLGFLLTDQGQGLVRIVAPSGEGVASDRRFEVSGGILAERGTDQATTRSARFERAPDDRPGSGALIRGDDPVLIEGPGYQLAGHDFRLDPATREITLGRGARLVAGLGGHR